jgi:N-acetylmuramate 1-kinase
MPDQDVRLQHLKVWLDEQLAMLFAAQGWGAVPPATLTAASSDASFRRYFRWEGAGRSFVVMDAPPPQENCKPFVDIAFLLAKSGINVPKIYAEDLERGFLLLNDLGNQTYLDVIDSENADDLFKDALQALLAFQQLPMVAPLPSYDVALLRRELELFPEWYVKRELGIEFDSAQQMLWQQVSDRLIDSALAQPKVLVHRDYMPRNLMLSEPNPGVLDFQDAVYGPVTYDVTCLFKDAFLSWPEERVRGWLADYWQQAGVLGIPVQPDFEDFLRASDLMGVQRHLKVIGIFARICHRDGKPRYLGDVPRFFAYIDAVVARRPELVELDVLLASLRQSVGVSA